MVKRPLRGQQGPFLFLSGGKSRVLPTAKGVKNRVVFPVQTGESTCKTAKVGQMSHKEGEKFSVLVHFMWLTKTERGTIIVNNITEEVH